MSRNLKDIGPCLDSIKIFSHVVFGWSSGVVACRSFTEKGGEGKAPPANIWLEMDDNITANIYEYVMQVNNTMTGCYVIPGTVLKHGQASSSDIVQMQTLLIDIDDGDTEEKLELLTNRIGEPTLIVESGGITSCGNKKLHIYWQLVKAVSGDDLQQLLHLRHKIALAVGGDIHFKSAHQPIRVAGSVYHKGGACRLVRIRHYQPCEYELEELEEAVKSLLGDDKSPTDPIPFNKLLISKVHAGAVDGNTRFGNLQRVIGFWLCRYHDGTVSQDKALEEISAYNQANVIPAWPEDKLQSMIDGLWKKHISKHGVVKHGQAKYDKGIKSIDSFALDAFLKDVSPMPKDIIAPRILTPSGLFVFGGAPKVGKSDFLLSLFTHMAAGEEFIGFKPPRPLRIFYFQSEIGYHYLRERLQNMKLPADLVSKASKNLFITPNTKLLLDEYGINILADHISKAFPDKPDIIAVDPLRNVFDGGRDGSTENENDAMLFFLQNRIEPLRDMVNPDAGIILVHHTKKLTQKQFDEEPFSAFSGASSLRGYYTSGAILRRSDVNPEERELLFELRNGANIATKIIRKSKGKWLEDNSLTRPVAGVARAVKLDAERDRRELLILTILKSEATKGRAYTIRAFSEAFDGSYGLGSNDSIRNRLKVLARKGYIKFFKDTDRYGFGKCTSIYGLICFEKMEIIDKNGEVHSILPTHYIHHEFEEFLPVEDPHIWRVHKGNER